MVDFLVQNVVSVVWRVISTRLIFLDLRDSVGSANCDAIGNEVFWFGECDAIAWIWIYELSLIILGDCDAIDLVDCSNGEFDLRMLSSYLN